MTYEQFQQRYQYNPSTDLFTEKRNISIYKAYAPFILIPPLLSRISAIS